MIYPFTKAAVWSGANTRQILHHEDRAPIGIFDSSRDPYAEAFRVMAVVSRAAGGQLLRRASLHINQHYVLLTGDTFEVLWGTYIPPSRLHGPDNQADLIVEEFQQAEVYHIPFSVRASKDSKNWREAIKC